MFRFLLPLFQDETLERAGHIFAKFVRVVSENRENENKLFKG